MAAGPLYAAAAGLAARPVLTPDTITEMPETGPGLRRLLQGCRSPRCAPECPKAPGICRDRACRDRVPF